MPTLNRKTAKSAASVSASEARLTLARFGTSRVRPSTGTARTSANSTCRANQTGRRTRVPLSAPRSAPPRRRRCRARVAPVAHRRGRQHGPRPCGSSSASPAEVGVKVLEHRAAAGEALLVVAGRGADAGDQGLDPVRLEAAKLAVLEVDVVHDLGDRPERGLAKARALEQHLEGAAVALVRELGLEHVEPELAGHRHIPLRGHELEAGLGVDEAPDEPGRRDTVDVHARTRHPGPSLELAEAPLGCRRLGQDRRRLFLAQPTLEFEEQTLGCLSAVGAEEVDRGDLGEPRLETRELRLRLRALFGRCIVADRRGEGAHLLGERVVVGIARPIEQGADLLVGKTIDETRLADHRLAAALYDLAQEPFEVLLAFGGRGKGVDGGLDGDRTQPLQAAPDLDPQVSRLGRQLMDQQQPTFSRQDGAVEIRHKASCIMLLIKSNMCIIMLAATGRVPAGRPGDIDMKWVTRERPVIDRIACPWLIARFIDEAPEFLFVPPERV